MCKTYDEIRTEAQRYSDEALRNSVVYRVTLKDGDVWAWNPGRTPEIKIHDPASVEIVVPYPENVPPQYTEEDLELVRLQAARTAFDTVLIIIEAQKEYGERVSLEEFVRTAVKTYQAVIASKTNE